MSDDISEIVRQLRTGEAIDRTAIAATLERLSAGKEEAFQWADKFKARAEAAEARLHAMSDEKSEAELVKIEIARLHEQDVEISASENEFLETLRADAMSHENGCRRCNGWGHPPGDKNIPCYSCGATGIEPSRRADAMSDDLIARLRRANDMEEGRGSGLFNEAADAIERLREEVRGLTTALGVTWSIGEG